MKTWQHRFLSLMLALLMMPPVMIARAETPQTRLTDFVTRLISGDDNGALYAQLDQTMQASLPRESFDMLWSLLEAQCGPFVEYYGDTESSEVSGYTVLTQLIDMEWQDLRCTMSLSDDGLIAGLYFTFDEIPTPTPVPTAVPTKAPPARVKEENVTVGVSPWRLPGTLLIPESDEPVPAVVLVQGSGATNRDEAIYSVRPFLDIANALSAQGIAVLRFDKRTYVYREKVFMSANYRMFTVEDEVIEDVVYAGKMLAEDPRIDSTRIFILGHSLGAMLAPRIVSESGDLFCGMILAAGTNRSFLDVLLRQAKDGTGLTEQEGRKIIEDGTAIYSMTEEESQKVRFLNIYAYYYWEMLHHPSPSEYLKELARPTLIINGTRDIQIIPEEGRTTWEKVLDMKAPWLTCYWTDVNHMMMRPDVKPEWKGTVNEYKVNCTVAEDITDMMAAFILDTKGLNGEE